METGHIAGHIVSLASIVGVLIGWLTPLASLLAIIWYGILIYEYIKNNRLGS